MFLLLVCNIIFIRRSGVGTSENLISHLLACFEHGDIPEFPLSEKQPRIPFFFLLSRTWSSLSLMQYCSLMSSLLYTGTTVLLLLPFWTPEVSMLGEDWAPVRSARNKTKTNFPRVLILIFPGHLSFVLDVGCVVCTSENPAKMVLHQILQ